MSSSRHPLFSLCLVVVPLTLSCSGETAPPPEAPIYPETATVDHVDVYHGTEVPDPYRWLEEDVRESERVQQWVEAQNAVTFAFLEAIPERRAIADRLRELWNFDRYGLPEKKAGRYFYSYNDGLQNQEVLYMQSAPDADPELLIDPNTWSDDGTVALASFYPSPDGRFLAYTVQDGGSDWRSARVMDLEARRLLDDELSWLKFTNLAWSPDGSGFYYSRYPEPEEGEEYQTVSRNQTVWFHRAGTSQGKDEQVFVPRDPDWGVFSQVTDDGAFLVLTIWKGTDNRYQIAYRDLSDPESEIEMLISGFENDYTLVGNRGSELIFRTDRGAERGRLIGIDVLRPEPERWREIVGEGEHVLREASLVGGRLIAEYLRDARSEVRIFDLEGSEVGGVDLPGIGTARGFEGEAGDPETFFEYSSFNRPPTIYRYDVGSGERRVFKRAEVDFDPEDYLVEQVFYRSADGTRVPMFISRRRDLDLDGARPAMLYGYGGFNVVQRPTFSITRLAWMEMGGIYAVANLRGGGEYGESWHQAGTRLDKQNVFDDFIAAAEYLIAEGYTRPDRLAVFGGSNGGLLVGAAVNQRPELFGAAIPAVGVMDMLRFHTFTAGRFWVDDYGSSEDPEEFRALLAYSPYHNVREGVAYPAVMATTADTDDRVVPAHSFKYIAALQRAQTGPAPVLIRIETRAGHGSGKPTDKVIREYADRWAFLVKALGVKLPPGYGQQEPG